MGRAFPFTYQGRALRISTMTVDEGWELWVVEGERKVMCVARVSVDEAVERAPWRRPDCIDCRKSQVPHFVHGLGLGASRRAARRMGDLGVPVALSISASGVPPFGVWASCSA